MLPTIYLSSDSLSELSKLKGLHISSWAWWPPAAGWYLTALAIVILCLLARYFLSINQTKKERLNSSLSIAAQNLAQYKQDKNGSAYLHASNQLLRQVAIQHYGRSTIAPLAGEHWIDFLNRHAKANNKKPLFNSEVAHALVQCAYQKDPKINIQKLNSAIQQWIKAQYLKKATSQQGSNAQGVKND